MAFPISSPLRGANPVYGVLLGAAAALFLGGLLADIGYARSFQIQWLNFAAWMIAGAMVFAGLALIWALVEVVVSRLRIRSALIALLLLILTFVLGLINSFVHARDAWGAMPAGLVLSVIVFLLAAAATGFGLFGPRRTGGLT